MSFEELCKSLCRSVVRSGEDSLQAIVEYNTRVLMQAKSDKFERIDQLRFYEALKRTDRSPSQVRLVLQLLNKIKNLRTSSDLPAKCVCFLYNLTGRDQLTIVPVTTSRRQMRTTSKPGELSNLAKLRQVEESLVPKALGMIMNADCGQLDAFPQPFSDKMRRLRDFGLLVKRVENIARHNTGQSAPYLIFQALQFVLREELNELYSLCATLNASSLTRLEVALYDARKKMFWLGVIADSCRVRTGCQLISAVHELWSRSGNSSFLRLAERVLRAMVEPLLRFVANFVRTGAVNDPYAEFFISVDQSVQDQDIWTRKYSLRAEMVPSVIPLAQAEMIISIGRCLGFLGLIDRSSLPRSPRFLQLVRGLSCTALPDDRFDGALLDLFHLVNRHVLDTFLQTHRFVEHVTAIKKYLLLSQGDFVRHLMDILKPELSLPASDQQRITLNIALDTAIQSTNARFESDCIIRRLSVRLLQSTREEVGWDIFSLYYDLPFPVNTVITRESVLLYLRAFNFLWRSKRLEYSLSSTWLRVMHDSRRLSHMPEMRSLLMVFSIAVSNMTMFVQQMQYYLSFEVLESSWDRFLLKVQQANELDDLRLAHDVFLQDILVGSFLRDSSISLLEELRTIFNIIFDFVDHVDATLLEAFSELGRRRVGLVNGGHDRFVIHLTDHKVRADVYLSTFQTKVKSFLSSLPNSGTEDLNFLAFRIDFNDFYFNK